MKNQINFHVTTALRSNKNVLKYQVKNQDKKPTGIIQTELPLVYRCGNVLTIENGFDLNRRNELWGIQLLSGTMVSLRYGPQTDVTSTTWEKIKNFAQTVIFNGKIGKLPSKSVLIKHWGNVERMAFDATVNILKNNDVVADDYRGCIWCMEDTYSQETPPNEAYAFILYNGSHGWRIKDETFINDRIAVTF